MADYRTLYDSDFLYAFHLAGKEHTLEIAKVTGGELTGQGGKKARKPLIYFRGKEKPLALNKTNGKTVAAMYGTDTRGWTGKLITIFATTTDFGGKTVDCIRIKPGIPRGKASQSIDESRSAPAEPPPTQEPYDGPPEDLREPGADG
jgi:hypothetical protein